MTPLLIPFFQLRRFEPNRSHVEAQTRSRSFKVLRDRLKAQRSSLIKESDMTFERLVATTIGPTLGSPISLLHS
ncbi:MAG: hypothetical protein OK454_10475 [Thaumarchaeota archaeon]|nr:hypothetical protein [Nitrososphaerota archaeon]